MPFTGHSHVLGAVDQVPVRDRYVTVVANTDYSMDLHDFVVRASGHTSVTSTITLPSVAEAAGLEYYISANIATSGIVNVADLNDDATLTTLVLDADEDHVVLRSNGQAWLMIENGIA